MSPTLRNGQVVLIRRNVREYRTDDLIVFSLAGEGNRIKRVIATAGDTVSLKQGVIERNGIKFSDYTCDAAINIEYILEENMLFVIGDNYNASIDSRDYGPIFSKEIIGRVMIN